jgi:hypothetical protein
MKIARLTGDPVKAWHDIGFHLMPGSTIVNAGGRRT